MEVPDEWGFLCFEALVNHLTRSNNTKVAARLRANDKHPKGHQGGVLICWTRHGKIRGYIGCANPVDLGQAIPHYAVMAASADSRFPPIGIPELAGLECHVIVLHSFEKAQNAHDWILGLHGIRLRIDQCIGMYLPQLPVEKGWSKEQTLANLAAESHFPGKYDEAALSRSSVQRYQTSRCLALWEPYERYITESQ
jgi:uncharacterized protein (TIGR00296 family)